MHTWKFQFELGGPKTSFFGTREEAEEESKRLANERGATVFVYSKDGYAGQVLPKTITEGAK